MKLESEGRPAIHDAQAGDIHAAVSGLSLPDHSFLVLERSRTSYLQAALQAGERFIIEYREGGPRNLRSVRADFSRDEVARLLESYLAGGDAWRTGIQWKALADPAARDPRDTVSLVCAVAAFVVLLDLSCAMNAPGGAERAGKNPEAHLSVAALLYLPAALVDATRFRQLKVDGKTRTVLGLIFAAIAIGYWIGRWTGHVN